MPKETFAEPLPRKITLESEKPADFHKLNIKTEGEFWTIFIDAKNNLNSLKNLAKSEHVSEEEFLGSYKEIEDEFVEFKTYLQKAGIKLPEAFQKNDVVRRLIDTYDDLINKIKEVKSKNDYMNLLPEMDKLPMKSFELNVYDKEHKEDNV